MQEETFQDCLKYWKNSDGYTKFWPNLAEKWNYKDGETLRQYFKLERKRRGIKKEESNKIITNSPKILLFDVETSPLTTFCWRIYDQIIQPDAIISDWFVFSYAAKWLFDDRIFSGVLTPKEAIERSDKRVVGSIWELLNSADIVISHNGDKFDIKKLNTRFLMHDINPPMAYRSIDTLKVVRDNFSFSSNKLDYINGLLGLGQKTETNFELWKKCFYGDSESLKKMCEYNENDVLILEELYLKVRPWIKNPPNFGLYVETCEKICPHCGSTNLNWQGYYTTTLGKYQAFRCSNCGAIGRSKQNELTPQKRKSLVR